jgi:hypothetical protein
LKSRPLITVPPLWPGIIWFSIDRTKSEGIATHSKWGENFVRIGA